MSTHIGVLEKVPIYEDVTVHSPAFNLNTIEEFFSITGKGTGYDQWTYTASTDDEGDYVTLTKNNVQTNTTGATTVLTALYDISDVKITGTLYVAYYGTFTMTVAGETLVSTSGKQQGVSSTGGNVVGMPVNWTGTLKAGEQITISHTKATSYANAPEAQSAVYLRCGEWEDIVQEIVGYEDKALPKTISEMFVIKNGMPQHVIEGYIVEQNILKLFFTYKTIKSYTGDYIATQFETDEGEIYELYELTSSGELVLGKDAKVWICGGGAGGETATSSGSSFLTTIIPGGGGAGGYSNSGELVTGTYNITIGEGGNTNTRGATTSIFDESGTVLFTAEGGLSGSSGAGGNGGTGGGAGKGKTAGTGDSVSKYPFNLTDRFDPHCGGGGAGGTRNGNTYTVGGNGGTNGNSGSVGTTDSTTTGTGGAGGVKGGGAGGTASTTEDGHTATFYGSGGGGGSANKTSSWGGTTTLKSGGAGYQGVVYLLAKKAVKSFMPSFVYCTGENTIQTIEHNGKTWNLMTITDSGELTIMDGEARIWACGGGAQGGTGSYEAGYTLWSGGGGGGGYVATSVLPSGTYSITIGAGGTSSISAGITAVGDIITASPGNAGGSLRGGSGGSGGGAGVYCSYSSDNRAGSRGTGAGVSTYPFGITSLHPHSAGGGGGYGHTGTVGAGGSNGRNGDSCTLGSYTEGGGAGGTRGGGAGGNMGLKGSDATFYGSAGGGGAAPLYDEDNPTRAGGNGYQGVCYVLWQDNPNSKYTEGTYYSGASTLSTVELNGKTYSLLTMTSSGTLELLRDDVEIWICGGGGGGHEGSNPGDYSYNIGGSGGGGGYVNSKKIPSGNYVFAIGQGGGNNASGGITTITKDGTTILSANGGSSGGLGTTAGGSGGSGGGGSGLWNPSGIGEAIGQGGFGAGVSTYPFGVTSLQAHSAGGGGGSSSITNCYRGGNGGSNGSNGNSGVKGSNTPVSSGGNKGGGAGNGGSATFYGSGGGGGSGYGSYGGSGYQGVAYALWPKS